MYHIQIKLYKFIIYSLKPDIPTIYPAIFRQISYHNNSVHIVLPNHSPKILHNLFKWT